MNLFILVAFLCIAVGIGAGINHDTDKGLNSWTIPLIIYVIIISLIQVGFYTHNSYSFADVETTLNYNIPNKIQLLNKLKNIVVVKSDNNNLIIDVANAGQSAKNTETWIQFSDEINNYNKTYTKINWYEDNPFLAFITYGAMPTPPSDLKFVRLNELTN